MHLITGALFFAVAAYIGVLAATAMGPHLERFEDGPTPAEPAIPWLVAGAAVIGVLVVSHATSVPQVLFAALLCLSLAAIWCTDSRYGIVPDVFTLGPLAIILSAAAFEKHWGVWIAALIVFIPFALAALYSKGVGMGWGDVKLAALGGAVLGAESATLAFALACIAAALVAFLRRRTRAPIAFAPYLAAAIAIAMPAGNPF